MSKRRRIAVQPRWRTVVGKTYDHVNMALWASLCAVIIFFVLFVAPNMHASRAAYEADRIARQQVEHDFYCKRWGMSPGTLPYEHCMSDLVQFRRSIENGMAEELDFIP